MPRMNRSRSARHAASRPRGAARLVRACALALVCALPGTQAERPARAATPAPASRQPGQPSKDALSPQRAAHRVELWSLGKRKLVKSLGSEPEIKLVSGATRVRQVLLRYDAARRLLFTLESFTGDLQVLSLDGKVVWRAKLDD